MDKPIKKCYMPYCKNEVYDVNNTVRNRIYCVHHSCKVMGCMLPRVTNRLYCKSHIARGVEDNYLQGVPVGTKVAFVDAPDSGNVEAESMANFYNTQLGPTLKEAFQRNLNVPLVEQLQVTEELALLRVTCNDAVAIYSRAVEAMNTAKLSGDAKLISQAESTLLVAGSVLRDVVEEVTKTAKVAADIEKSKNENITVFSLQVLVKQIIEKMYEACGRDYHFLAKKFHKKIDEELRLPLLDGGKGTRITPDQQVQEMDSLIPLTE